MHAEMPLASKQEPRACAVGIASEAPCASGTTELRQGSILEAEARQQGSDAEAQSVGRDASGAGHAQGSTEPATPSDEHSTAALAAPEAAGSSEAAAEPAAEREAAANAQRQEQQQQQSEPLHFETDEAVLLENPDGSQVYVLLLDDAASKQAPSSGDVEAMPPADPHDAELTAVIARGDAAVRAVFERRVAHRDQAAAAAEAQSGSVTSGCALAVIAF
jgi:hypothetical protein